MAVAASNVHGLGSEAQVRTTPPVLGRPLALVPLIGVDSFVLEWRPAEQSESAPVTGYRVRWRPRGASSYAGQRDLAASARRLEVAGLTAGAAYDIEVLAMSAVGDGPAAGLEVSLVDAPAAPGKPQHLSTVFGIDRAVVSWSPPYSDGGSAVTKYKLSWAGHLSGQAEVAGTSYEFADYQFGAQLMFRISAVNSAGEGPPALIAASAVGPPPPPYQPGLTAGVGELTVSWWYRHPATPLLLTGGGLVTAYRVQWKSGAHDYSEARQAEVPTGDGETLEETTHGVEARLEYTIPWLDNGTLYTVRILGVNAAGVGAALELSGAPAAPAVNASHGLAVELDNESLALSWEPPDLPAGTTLDGYQVQWRLAGEAYDDARSEQATGTLHGLSGLDPGILHFVRVTALVSDGSGGFVEGRGVPISKPLAATGLTSVAGNRTTVLSWTPPEPDPAAPAAAYVVRWTIGFLQLLYTQDTSVDISLPESVERSYAYTVYAVNAVGESPRVNHAMSAGRTPGKPLDLVARTADGSLAVSWSPPASGADGYQVQWRTSDGAFSDTQQADTDATRYEIGGLTSGSAHVVRVAARNGLGLGPWTEVLAAAEGFSDRPTAPLSLAVVPGDGLLLVSWSAPPILNGATVDAYKLEWRSIEEAYSDLRSVEMAASQLTHQITGLDGGTAYELRVRAVTTDGDLGAATVTRGQPQGAPGMPADAVIHATDEVLFVSWEPPESGGNPNRYRVMWRSADQQFPEGSCSARYTIVRQPHFALPFLGIPPVASTASTKWTELVTGQEYHIRIQAENAHGSGPAVDLSAVVRARPG